MSNTGQASTVNAQLADALPIDINALLSMYAGQGQTNPLGMEFGKNKDLVLYLLRLMQKQEDVKKLTDHIDKLEKNYTIKPMMADVLRIRAVLQEGQDIMMGALDPKEKKDMMTASRSLFTMMQFLSAPDEAYHPVVTAIDEGMTKHDKAFMSRAGKDEYNTMKNVFDMFTKQTMEQKYEERMPAAAAPVKKSGRIVPWF